MNGGNILSNKKNLITKATVKCVLFIILSIMTGIAAQAKEVPFSTKSHAYVVMDANSGKILYYKNANKKIYPASTAKIMTAMVALENNDNSDIFTINVNDYQGMSSSVQRLYLASGTEYTLTNLLHTLLIYSDAGSAMTLACQTTGNKNEFISLMNDKAKELGLTHTSFDNPIGLDIGNGYYNTYTTAKEMAKLTRYAMGNSKIRKIVAKPTYTLPKKNGKAGITIKNTNLFYSSRNDYRKDLFTIIGTKTGTTNAAGHVLSATAVDEEGHEVICAYFGNYTTKNTYSAINRIFTYVFREYNNGELDLTEGFCDMRDSDYEALVNEYLNAGYLELTEDQCFHPDKPVTELEFVTVFNEITGQNLQGEDKKAITIERLKELYFAANPVTGFASTTEKEAKENALWEQLIEEEYLEVPEDELNRLDMIRISDSIKKSQS